MANDQQADKGSTFMKMKGQEFLARQIRRSGAGGIFFVPTFLYPTLVELADDPIKRVLTHSERAAAYMADGCAEASNKVGWVITQGGPGAANLIAGFGDAWESNTPILGLTTLIPTTRYHGNSYQEVYVDFGPVTKYDAEIRTIGRLPDLLGEALREASTGAPRPVHLYVDGTLEPMEGVFNEAFLDERYFSYPAFRPKAEEDAVDKAARILERSERPIVVAGRGAVVSGAWNEVTALAERLNMTVTGSLGGKGIIDEHHPLSVGTQGSYRRSCANDMIDVADVVLYIGSHVGGATSVMGQSPVMGKPKVLHIDIDPAQPGKNYPATVAMIGDARVVVQQLIDALDNPNPASRKVWVARCRKAVKDWWQEHDKHVRSDASPIRPERLAVEVAKAIPDNAIVVSDTGYSAAWSGAFMDLPAGRSYLACEGSLGWAFAASIGAKCGAPDRPVISWIGDGGFYYHMAEIETAVRNKINVVSVVMNNHALVFDTHLLQAFWSASHDVDLLSEFKETNFANIAKELGGHGIRVEDPGKIGDAVREALDYDGPTVIDVVIDHAAVAPVSFMAGQASRGGMLTAPEKIK